MKFRKVVQRVRNPSGQSRARQAGSQPCARGQRWPLATVATPSGYSPAVNETQLRTKTFCGQSGSGGSGTGGHTASGGNSSGGSGTGGHTASGGNPSSGSASGGSGGNSSGGSGTGGSTASGGNGSGGSVSGGSGGKATSSSLCLACSAASSLSSCSSRKCASPSSERTCSIAASVNSPCRKVLFASRPRQHPAFAGIRVLS